MIIGIGRDARLFDFSWRPRLVLIAISCLLLCAGPSWAQIDTARVQISFSAPGDDGDIGRAALYDIRYSTSPINQGNFDQATPVPDNLPLPGISGTTETIAVSIPNALLGTTYYFALRARDEAYNWSLVSNSPSFYYGIGAGINDSLILPHQFALLPNYPNPFNASTRIEFNVPAPATTRITIWNALGQQVRDLVDDDLPAGLYEITWDGRDDGGRNVPSGTYFYQLISGKQTTTRKMTLLK